MPHLWLEVPVSVEAGWPEGLLADLHACMADSGLFSPEDIKGRVHRMSHAGQGYPIDMPRFVHLQVALMPGRSPQQQQQLALALLNIISGHAASTLSPGWQLSVELRELLASGYAKRTS